MKLAVAVSMFVALAGVARADNRDDAEALFQQGKQLMVEQRYAEACEAFEKSNQLDPGIGAQLNIAKCYEDWGKLARAYLAYQVAQKMANDASDPRAPKIDELVQALEQSVPQLTIKLPADAPEGLKVTLDGRSVEKLNEPMVVDPGSHTIEWSVAGRAKQTKVIAIDPGGQSEVTLDTRAAATAPPATDAAAPMQTDDAAARAKRNRMQRMIGLGVGGLGVLAIGVSGVMTLSARGDYNDALDMHCGGMKNNCDMTGLELTRDARSTANKATFIFFAGAALVGGGVALYLLAPKDAPASESQEQSVYVTPTVSPDGIGVVLGGKL